MFKWPLNINNFNFVDKLKICLFFLNKKNYWTMDKYVKMFEKEMGAFVGSKYSLFVSSGSTANTILAMYLRDKLKKENSKRNIVILPSTTWTTSCAPWIREGFEPYFIDISLTNFGMDLDELSEYLHINHEKVAAVFPTCLLGFNLFYGRLNYIKDMYPEIFFSIDQCENNFANFDGNLTINPFQKFTSTTSTYFGHEIQSVEGGFIFTNNINEYEQFLMYRNHGILRSLNNTTFQLDNNCGFEPRLDGFSNPKVDERFDFYSLGSNFRNSDINAFIGLLDLKKSEYHIDKRKKIYNMFQYHINRSRYLLPSNYTSHYSKYIPFCLPIILKGENKEKRLILAKRFCIDKGIETRPIISGFLGYQTAYKDFMNEENYPNSIYLHKYGFYIGLNDKIKIQNLMELVNYLNTI